MLKTGVGVPSEDILFRLEEYEKKVGKLSELLIEEELAYKALLSERDQRITQLESIQGGGHGSPIPGSPSLLLLTPQQQTVYPAAPPQASSPQSSSPQSSCSIPPLAPPSGYSPSKLTERKVKILETRIVDMTVTLEEKDKRIFELENEIDSLKVELNQMRVEASRVGELEARIFELEIAEGTIGELQARIVAHESTISELEEVVCSLKAEIDLISSERLECVHEHTQVEALEARIAKLEEELEVSETNRQILKENFCLENVQKLKLIEQLAGCTPRRGDARVEAPVDTPVDIQVGTPVDAHADIPADVPKHEYVEPDSLLQECIEPESCIESCPESCVQQDVGLLPAPASPVVLEELKCVANSVAELESEATPDDIPGLFPASPPAKCGGCLYLFKKRITATN